MRGLVRLARCGGGPDVGVAQAGPSPPQRSPVLGTFCLIEMLDGGAAALWEQTQLAPVEHLLLFSRRVGSSAAVCRPPGSDSSPFPRFSPLAACAPVTYTRIQSVPSFLTYLKLRERIFPEFLGRPNSSLSNWELFWDRPVLITRHCLKLLYDLMVFILSNRSAESGQS